MKTLVNKINPFYGIKILNHHEKLSNTYSDCSYQEN